MGNDDIEFLREQIVNTNGALIRLMAIIGGANPPIAEQIGCLVDEWQRVTEEINKDYGKSLVGKANEQQEYIGDLNDE